MTTTGLPGAGCERGRRGGRSAEENRAIAKKMDIRAFDRRRTLTGSEQRVFDPDGGAQKIVRDDSSEWIIDVRGPDDSATRQ